MDSYFATVEQQARPYLRGKPVVVSGKEGSRSVIVASSREAKRLGIKTGMLHFEARSIFKDIIFVEPDGAKYVYLTKLFIEIFKKFTEVVEVFSIDEAFLDMSGHCKTVEQAICSAEKIKQEVQRQLGSWVTCSIGIAENKLLSKLASNMNKPDGLFLIDEHNKNSVLKKIKLTDFCGIGRRIEKRLEALGVQSVERLSEYPLAALINEFGPHSGKKLFGMSRGEDDEPVVSYLKEIEPKSVGRAHTMKENTYDKEKILLTILHLCDATGRELRRKKLAGKTIVIYWRYNDFTYGGTRKTFKGYVSSGMNLYKLSKSHIEKYSFPKSVRLVGVHVSNLVKNYKQLPLWEDERKMLKVLPYLDKINDEYGELTIKPAFLLKQKRLRNKVGGFKIRD